MTFKFFNFSLLWPSIWIILSSLIIDIEFFCFMSPLVIWHFWNGFANIVTDYVYAKVLKLILLFFLQISVFLTFTHFITFLF